MFNFIFSKYICNSSCFITNIFTLFYYSDDMIAIFHTCMQLVEQDIDLKVTNKLCTSSNARSHAIG